MVGNVFPVLLVAGGLTAAYGFLDGGWSPCSICGDPIDVTLTAKNHFVEPYFEFSVTIQQTSQRELVSLMQEAADIDGRFNFTVSYSGNVGFFIESINKQEGDTDWTGDHSWWHIYSLEEDGSGVARCEGVSTYIPSHEETVVFLLSDQFLNMSHCPEV